MAALEALTPDGHRRADSSTGIVVAGGRPRWQLIAYALLILIAGAGGWYFSNRGGPVAPAAPTEPISVLVAEFQNNTGDPVRPIKGDTIPVYGLVAFVDHKWNDEFSSSIGYSRQDNNNSDGQAANACKTGQYALGNILYLPMPNVMAGGELQWGRRQNFSDGFHSDGFKLQFSFKYNFSWKLGG